MKKNQDLRVLFFASFSIWFSLALTLTTALLQHLILHLYSFHCCKLQFILKRAYGMCFRYFCASHCLAFILAVASFGTEKNTTFSGKLFWKPGNCRFSVVFKFKEKKQFFVYIHYFVAVCWVDEKRWARFFVLLLCNIFDI